MGRDGGGGRRLHEETKKKSKVLAAMRLLLLLLWASLALALNNTFFAAPYVNIRPPFQTAKEIFKYGYLIIDIGNALFYVNCSMQYGDSFTLKDMNPVYLSGDLFFQNPGLIRFSFKSMNKTLCPTCCIEPGGNSPPQCPYLQTLLSGDFSFGAYPNDGISPTKKMDVEPYADPTDPNTGKLMNFFGAFEPITWECQGTCESMTSVVPPVPQPIVGLNATSNLTCTVREDRILGWGYVGAPSCASDPPNTVAGDWTATRLFEGSNRVVTTIEEGVGTYTVGSPPSVQINTYLANVKDYGAVGDGVTDDTFAIQSAINDAVHLSINFPAGTYLIKSELKGNVSSKHLWSLEGAILKGAFLSSNNIIRVSANNLTFTGLIFDGGITNPLDTTVVSLVVLASATNISFLTFRSCQLGHTNGYGLVSFSSSGSLSFLRIDSCEFTQFLTTKSAIQLSGPPTMSDIQFTNNLLHDSVSGWAFGDVTGAVTGQRLVIEGNTVSLGVNSFTSGGVGVFNWHEVVIQGNDFSDNRIAMSITDSSDVAIVGNTGRNIYSYVLEAYKIDRLTFTGNSFSEFSRGIVMGFGFVDPSALQVDHVYSSNTFTSSIADDFINAISNPPSPCRIEGNIFRNTNSTLIVNAVRFTLANTITFSGNTLYDASFRVTDPNSARFVVNNNQGYYTQNTSTANVGAMILYAGTDWEIMNNNAFSLNSTVNLGPAIANDQNASTNANILISNNLGRNFASLVNTAIGGPANTDIVGQNNRCPSCTTAVSNTGTDAFLKRKLFTASAAPTTGTWNLGDVVFNDFNAGTTGAPFAWQNSAAGTPGTWEVLGVNRGIYGGTIVADASITLTPGTSRALAFYQANITADRTVTLSSTGVWSGITWTVVRGPACFGNFKITVGTGLFQCILYRPGQWCSHTNAAAQYLLVGSGNLLSPNANPASVAFGSAEADGAKGLLTFTVTTAALTCGTATVTNYFVTSNSIVTLVIQGYSGTATDDFDIKRLDTAGSSAGSFTIQLCNRNAVGALSGSLYIGFTVD